MSQVAGYHDYCDCLGPINGNTLFCFCAFSGISFTVDNNFTGIKLKRKGWQISHTSTCVIRLCDDVNYTYCLQTKLKIQGIVIMVTFCLIYGVTLL